MMAETLTLREVARRLIAAPSSTGDGADSSFAAASRICDHLYRDLSRWIGSDGCHALFARALARTQSSHPALRDIRLGGGSDSCLEGVAESGKVHGANAVAEGLEAMLVALIELLGRLIGDDMASKLIEQSVARDTQDPARPQAGRAAP
ncbi:MAG TPA: hypothetical protein VFH13_00400 [Gemmatimonadaceae bacterium]|nr:hypothetical protein [Gemmatimonadaceae bacterium]